MSSPSGIVCEKSIGTWGEGCLVQIRVDSHGQVILSDKDMKKIADMVVYELKGQIRL